MHRTVIILAVIFGLAALLAFAYFFIPRPAAPPLSKSDLAKPYANASYDYSLSYPASLDAKEYIPEDVVFGHIDGDAVQGVAEARVITFSGAPGTSLAEAAAKELMNLCAADGPGESFMCADVISSVPYSADAGANGFRIMFDGQLKDLASGSIKHIAKGPYIVFPLASGATASSALVIAPPLNQSAAEADAAMVAAIARTVRIGK